MDIEWEDRSVASDGDDGCIPTTPREMGYHRVRENATHHKHGRGEHVQYSVSGSFPFFILTYRTYDGYRVHEQTVHSTLEETLGEAQAFEDEWFNH